MALVALAAARPASQRCGFAAACYYGLPSSRTFAGLSQQPQPDVQHSSPDRSEPSSSSSSSPSSAAAGPDKDGYQMVYQGFFARPHKRLKYASLLNTFASFAAAPLIISYSSASPIARVAVTTWVIAFALITTGGLHWFTSPYVHQLLFNQQDDRVRAQTLSLLGGTKWHEFPVSSASEPTGYHPLASFKAGGRTYYIDRANFQDPALMERLMPWAAGQDSQDSSSTLLAQEDSSSSSSGSSQGPTQ